MDEQQLSAALMGLMPTPAYLLCSVFFGIAGMIAYRHGKKTGRSRTKWTGVALMFYPYLIGSNTRVMVLVGTALCGLLYFFRD